MLELPADGKLPSRGALPPLGPAAAGPALPGRASGARASAPSAPAPSAPAPLAPVPAAAAVAVAAGVDARSRGAEGGRGDTAGGRAGGRTGEWVLAIVAGEGASVDPTEEGELSGRL